MVEQYKRPCGHPECSVSEGIHERLAFGRGTLDANGFWSIPCGICARAAEKTDGEEEGSYWPHTSEVIMILRGEAQKRQRRLRIWLDDQVPPDRELGPWDAWFMNAESLLQLIKLGVVTFIHFDHDLGHGMNGYELAKEIERLAFDNAVHRIDWNIHSGNPIGAGRIAAAMQKAGESWSAYESREPVKRDQTMAENFCRAYGGKGGD